MRVSWLTRAEMHDRHLDACRVRVVYKQVKSRFSEGLNKHTDIKETIKVFVQLIESLTWVRTVTSVMIIFTQFPSSKVVCNTCAVVVKITVNQQSQVRKTIYCFAFGVNCY